MSEPTSPPAADIVARAGRYYRNARYVICAMALGAGLWFAYDGWINWPNYNKQFLLMDPSKRVTSQQPHSETDIALQQRLAYVLIPLAPLLLGFFLYRSRGEYRLSGTTLHVPGHPPVPADAITALDMSKWKRKGVAFIHYKLPGATEEARLKLDDFVYDQVPTDKIVEQLEEWIAPEDAPSTTDAPTEAQE